MSLARIRGFWMILVCVMAVCGAAAFAAEERTGQTDELARDFVKPPDAVRPWAYWWWVNGNVDKATITRDLEAMKARGFAGLLMFDARGYHDDHLPPPPPKMEFMSTEWRELLRFAMGEAQRVGLKMSVNLSSCAGALRGPWPVGEDAPKKLVWAERGIEGGKKINSELPKGNWTNARDVAVLAVRKGKIRNGKDLKDSKGQTNETLADVVVDLTEKVKDGKLAWDAPAGYWNVLRFAYVFIEGKEIDVDILDAEAVKRYYDRMGKALIQDAGPLAGKTLTNFYSVSWEGAVPTWTRDFENIFEKARGYKLRPWMPALTGAIIISPEQSRRFLRDYNKTLSECFMNHCYGTLSDLSRRDGLQWHSESGGPWDRKLPSFADADQLAFMGVNDMPQGEFWVKPERNFHNPPVMAAHIYGRPIAASEAFTNMQGHWSEYPAVLKPRADSAFCDGINHLIWHTFTCSPPEFGKPGIEYFAGTHLNPNVTWFEQSGAFIDYLARCQAMLRRGKPVVDACVYTGDRPYMHWGRGEKWSDKPTLKPVRGHAYDLINTEALIERLSVKDGQLVLPDGMSYRMLVVDLENESVPQAALAKIAGLARDGATIVLGKNRPTRTPGLTGYPEHHVVDAAVARAAKEVWEGKRKNVLSGMTLEQAFPEVKCAPDFEGPFEFAHRRDGEAEIYFVAGSGKAECTFRVSGKTPELWDAVSGKMRAAEFRETADGRATLTLDLPENGSTFVVFKTGTALSPEKNMKKIAALDIHGPWEVRFAPGWGAPEKATLEKLVPWNEHADEGIKYFSGTATYKKTFNLPQSAIRNPQSAIILSLGEVKHVAEVRVNGKPLGVVWTAPWEVDITSAVKAGANELEIAVTNLWVNRLIGDAKIPDEAQRLTKTHARRPPDAKDHALLKGYKADDQLERSGLIGPMMVKFNHE